MYAISMNDLHWSSQSRSFVPTNHELASRYDTRDDAVEAAQEDAALPPDSPWSIVEAQPLATSVG